jgi:hypothetical protein
MNRAGCGNRLPFADDPVEPALGAVRRVPDDLPPIAFAQLVHGWRSPSNVGVECDVVEKRGDLVGILDPQRRDSQPCADDRLGDEGCTVRPSQQVIRHPVERSPGVVVALRLNV